MIKQTLVFPSPSYLSLRLKQLCIKRPDLEEKNVHIEDVGVVILEHPQITITHQVIRAFQDNNVIIVSCDERHMPMSMMLPIEGHTLQSKRYRYQISASEPLRKQLWQQTVIAKVQNQAAVLRELERPYMQLVRLSKRVLSGDSNNIEAQAAAYYWRTLINDEFVRDQYGDPPNNLLNYGYSILRSMIARALVSSGLLLTLGIHHKNQYNAFCLADDIMEPYRPMVDLIVMHIIANRGIEEILSKESRVDLLQMATVDTRYGRSRRPMMVGMAYTSASLADCYLGKKKKIIYPSL